MTFHTRTSKVPSFSKVHYQLQLYLASYKLVNSGTSLYDQLWSRITPCQSAHQPTEANCTQMYFQFHRQIHRPPFWKRVLAPRLLADFGLFSIFTGMIGKSLSHFLFLTLEIKYSAVSVRSEMEQLYHCKGVGELGLLILSKTSLVKSGPSTLSNTLFFVFFWRFVCRFCLRRG